MKLEDFVQKTIKEIKNGMKESSIGSAGCSTSVILRFNIVLDRDGEVTFCAKESITSSVAFEVPVIVEKA